MSGMSHLIALPVLLPLLTALLMLVAIAHQSLRRPRRAAPAPDTTTLVAQEPA